MMNTKYTQYSDRNKELQNVVSVRVEITEMLTTNFSHSISKARSIS